VNLDAGEELTTFLTYSSLKRLTMHTWIAMEQRNRKMDLSKDTMRVNDVVSWKATLFLRKERPM
jgi:hypothetical protein